MIGITKYEVPVSLMNEKKEGCCLIDAKDLSRGSSSPDMAAFGRSQPGINRDASNLYADPPETIVKIMRTRSLAFS